MLCQTTFFSTVQIKDIKFADKSLRHDLHNTIGHLGVSPAAWITKEFLTHAFCREGKEILSLVSAQFLFTLTFVLAYDFASHSGIYPKFLPLAQRINPL